MASQALSLLAVLVMHPSLRVCSARPHQPLIRFLGKRSWPPSAHPEPKPHPSAPDEIKQGFGDFLKRLASSEAGAGSSATTGGNSSFDNFWDAPDRFWRPKNRELEDSEIDLVLNGGAL
ncbi:hypothetical protein DL96DRAFT_1802465 [Flagelloscypha sp. PMI_526]|nr:hypothetical protein DL96DRAFT_1802465 [Flagelloscypha sp. PMI_526]